MDRFNEILTNVTNVFKDENGPAYAGIIGIVIIILGRYGYKFKTLDGNSETSFEPSMKTKITDTPSTTSFNNASILNAEKAQT